MSNNHSLERSNIPWQLALISNLLIIFGLMVVAQFIGGIVMYLYIGRVPVNADFIVGGANAAQIKNMILLGQIGGTLVGLLILPSLYLFFLKKELIPPILNPSRTQLFPFLLAAIALVVLLLPVVGIVGDWNKNIDFPESVESWLLKMEERGALMTKLIVEFNSASELLIVLFTVALLPAVAEELVFRGILQNDLIRSTGNIHLSVFISAAVFSFIHFQFFGFFPRMLLGIVLGYLYITSGNIMVSMLMHFTNNAMVVIALNMHSKGVLKMDPESSKDLPTESIYISIILSSAVLYYCWSLYKQRTNIQQRNV